MRILAHIEPGPNWVSGRSVFEQGPPLQEHLDYMRQGFDTGSLLIGGPLATGASGAALLELADLQAAAGFAACDPAVAAGVLVYRVDELLTYFDALAGLRRVGPVATLSRRGPAVGPA